MLGKRINELRKEKEISQKNLGELLGFSQQAVAKWENGSTEPDSETLVKISKIFNVDVNLLLGRELKNLEDKSFFSDRQVQLLTKYNCLDDKGKEIVELILDNEFTRAQSVKEKEILQRTLDELLKDTSNKSDLLKGFETMKLNHDCVRDVLLYLEENLTGANPIGSEEYKKHKEFEKYTYEEIGYSLEKLKEAGYIDGKNYISDRYLTVFKITNEGHKYLDTIRGKDFFESIKKAISEKALPLTFEIIMSVASNLINEKLK